MAYPSWGEIAQLIVAVGGLVAILMGQRSMHHAMNSRLDELVEARSNEARSEGQRAGRQEARDERGER